MKIKNNHTRTENVIYELQMLCYTKTSHYLIRYKINVAIRAFFQTHRDAECKIQHLYRIHSNIYCFYISEIPFGAERYERVEYNARKVWLYLHDGTLFTTTLASGVSNREGVYEPFLGRPAAECRFKEGDIVEVLCGDTVTLQIVDACPWTPDRVERLQRRVYMERGITTAMMDCSDDCYLTLCYRNGHADHNHPAVITVLPPRFAYSSRRRERLRKLRKAMADKK